MMDSGTLRAPAAWQNRRFGKRLGDEIYVASEPSATPLRSYAPQSNFFPVTRVALPWTPGTEMLSTLVSRCHQACAEAIRLSRGLPPSISFQADFHHDAG
jgi:hypothetical protein